MATREEMLAWAKSLNPGDKVAYIRNGWPEDNVSILEVARITPSGRVITIHHMTFSQSKYNDELYVRGRGYGKIVPVTEELLQKAQQQDAERAEKERKRATIVEAQKILRTELEASRDMTYERAVKIIESLGGKYAENSENN